jgi:hypothetical protein
MSGWQDQRARERRAFEINEVGRPRETGAGGRQVTSGSTHRPVGAYE